MKNNKNLSELMIQAGELIKAKEFDKAINIYEAILEIDNLNSQALTHLPIIYLMKNRFEDAINMMNKSFEVVEPTLGDYQNLATAYVALKDYDNAIKTYNKIIKINQNIASIYKLLGDAQIEIADHPGALASYRNALKLAPEKFEHVFDYGVALHINMYHSNALEVLRDANKMNPNHIECMNKIASCLSAIGSYKEAILLYKKLMKLAPNALGPVIDYASNLWYEGEYEEPIKILKKVLRKNPNKQLAQQNLGLFQLRNKKFKEGWKYYDGRIVARNVIDKTKRHDMLKNYFDIDNNIEGIKIHPDDKIIILVDAGLGDMILCLSMIKEFQKIYSNLSAEVDYRLVNLFKRSAPDVTFYPLRNENHKLLINYNLDKFDKGIYWGSIAKYVRKDISDFSKVPLSFLKPNIENVSKIGKKLKKEKQLVCGLSWKSAAVEANHKNIQLEELLPILSIKNVRFLDLQYETKENFGANAIEKKNIKKDHNINIEEYKDIDKYNDIDGLTALISNCDVVVTSSNITAHIAGGLGVKTFLFVPFSRGRLWYWHDEGKSIWYPSIRIFRAESAGEWGAIFEKIAKVIADDVG